MRHSLLVAITCYNCEAQIPRVLEQLKSKRAQLWVDEAIVIDNRSSDGTVTAAKAALQNVPVPAKLVQNRSNYGLGGSHKSAFSFGRRSGFTHVVILHGDDQANLEDLLEVLEREGLSDGGSLLGARFQPGSKLDGYSAFRTLGNRVFNWMFSLSLRRRVYDLGSGLNLYSMEAVTEDWIHNFADDLTFNYHLFLGLFDRGCEAQFFPITWREKDQVSNVKLLSQAIRVLKLLAGFTFNSKWFYETDHRERVRDQYVFDVLAKNNHVRSTNA